MPSSIALVACVATKAATPRPARDLYTSPWFRKASAYAQQVADAWYILSAKHGLLAPDEVISPYNVTLNRMPVAERRAWARQVLRDLIPHLQAGDRVVILAGQRYREHLIEQLKAHGCAVEIPMEGLSFGPQLSWLNAHIEA